MNIKEELFKKCVAYVNKRMETVEEIISSNKKALQSETKSSAGDKHETGRAMLQLEMEKASQQLSGIERMKETLSKINLERTSQLAHLGNIIVTDKNLYFLSISSGQHVIANKTYFSVSVSSPIGRLLLGKKTGDFFVFNGNKQTIKEIF
ncbi:3-oxoacyl-ACP synthase [uncultured Tenacibaculum sp.]|uniref:3-oxoacyl-ACP synthase n=1 Tax=uncultured Tenacibaculum sp. TaxID=174713 RepID=UPI00262E0892|nr:3-oxoacyl-ACP synthase [uncultured Tenacibaculum sp.]